MHPKVGAAVRRVALKKLFSDPHFNAMTARGVLGDWTGGDPISEEMLKTLNQARTVLFDEEEAARTEAGGSRRTAITRPTAAARNPAGDGRAEWPAEPSQPSRPTAPSAEDLRRGRA